MALRKHCLKIVVLLSTLIIGIIGIRYNPETYTCRLLTSKFVDAQPWLEYPIIFEPIHRGRLTIWSGISSLPASQFKCYPGWNGTASVLLDFSNYADKLEWTYYDKNRGTTSHGFSVSHRESVIYRIDLNSRQLQNYLECNKIKKIGFFLPEEEIPPDIRTTCGDCKEATISLVNSQISELLRLQLNEHIFDGLYWHLSQLVSSQHFSGPILLNSDFN